MTPRVKDNDRDEITVTLDGRELRGWSYENDAERRTKMLMAREFVEGWFHREAADAWLPIKTAPKDGSKVLLGRFTGSKNKDDRDGFMAIDRYRGPKDNAGFIGWGKFNTIHWPPTHWQPVPKPPVPS